MIKLENVGIKFSLEIERNYSFKQFFIDIFKNIKRQKINQEFWALKDITIDIEAGEVIGLVGSNGAGKSTLLKVVAGVMKPTIGKVAIGGSINPMIELGAGFDMELTARENIFLNSAVLGYSEKMIKEKFNEIVAFSELEDFIDVPVRNFSSGMVARLAFSIATIIKPEILVVDEILSVGDLSFQEKSYAKMKSLIKCGTTVLYVSHNINSIQEMCDRVIWLDHGKIMMIGNPKKVVEEYSKNMKEQQSK